MSHEIYINKRGDVSFAYYGDMGWHRLGNPIINVKDKLEWKLKGGYNWEILTAAVNYFTDSESLMSFDGQCVHYRSDTLDPLAVNSSQFKVHQPQDILDFMFEVCDKADLDMETLGVLRGGKRFFALAKVKDDTLIERFGKPADYSYFK